MLNQCLLHRETLYGLFTERGQDQQSQPFPICFFFFHGYNSFKLKNKCKGESKTATCTTAALTMAIRLRSLWWENRTLQSSSGTGRACGGVEGGVHSSVSTAAPGLSQHGSTPLRRRPVYPAPLQTHLYLLLCALFNTIAMCFIYLTKQRTS